MQVPLSLTSFNCSWGGVVVVVPVTDASQSHPGGPSIMPGELAQAGRAVKALNRTTEASFIVHLLIDKNYSTVASGGTMTAGPPSAVTSRFVAFSSVSCNCAIITSRFKPGGMGGRNSTVIVPVRFNLPFRLQ